MSNEDPKWTEMLCVLFFVLAITNIYAKKILLHGYYETVTQIGIFKCVI